MSCKGQDQHTKKTYKARPRRIRPSLARKTQIILEAKNNPCECCGNRYHYSAMQFHHRDPSTKIEAISRMRDTAGIDALTKEIAKCALLCANCHAEIHAGVRELPEIPRTGIEPVRSKTDAF